MGEEVVQRVDPFIPVAKPQARRPFPGLVNNVPRPARPSTGTSVDGLVRRPAHTTTQARPDRERIIVHASHTRQPQLQPRPATENHQTKTQPKLQTPRKATKRSWLATLEPPAAFIAIITAGFLLQSVIIGEVLLSAYAVYAFVRRVPSRTTFALALLAFLGIVAILMLRGTTQLAINFAVYAFLLLTIGTATLLRELYTYEA